MSFPVRLLAAFCAIVLLFIGPGVIAPSQAQTAQVGRSSGLPVPRFVSVRNAPVNVRVGPGTQYQVAFTFLRPGIPVEITAEFDTWRRIRDVEGDEGWVHQNLVVGDRTALVAPWQAEGPIALRVGARPEAAVRAWLAPNMLVSVRSCDATACEIRLNHTDPDGRATTYQGFIAQDMLWGVYGGEIFD